ncbi:hypothetical protein BTUL_0072g00270 [Botrytis tulipae]|uniref:Protein kinase domain-containing protein n=1 Tax=Botrytis tulipae TaxID=87230 RepID=A0A4Z1EPW9_9HELO|nr:hypothetical protein BTUL_0072g00270 [Botrytis tulipae]
MTSTINFEDYKLDKTICFLYPETPTTRVAFRLQQNQKHVPTRVPLSKLKEHPSESSTQELPSAEIPEEEGTLRERTPFIEENSDIKSPSAPPPPLLTLRTDAHLSNNKAEFLFGSDSLHCDFLLDDKKTNGISGLHLRLYFSHESGKSNRENIILCIENRSHNKIDVISLRKKLNTTLRINQTFQLLSDDSPWTIKFASIEETSFTLIFPKRDENQESTRIFQENLNQFVNRPNINDPQPTYGGISSKEIETPQVPQRTWDWDAKEQLGGGGQSSVYKVKDKKTGECFAAKIFGQHKHFKKELGYLKVLKHTLVDESSTASQLGTPCYMGPERTRGDGYGEKDDVWALGIVVLDMHYLLPASKPYWLVAKAREPIYEKVWKKWMGDVKKVVEGLKGDGDAEMTREKERGIQVYDVLRGMLMEDENERLCAKDVIDLLSRSREAEGKRKGIRLEHLNSDLKRLRGKGTS